LSAGLVVKDSTISHNSASYGGGIYINSSTSLVQILNSTISTNSAIYGGSGIEDHSSGAQIVNSTVVANTSSNSAAGISSASATWLANTIVAGNTNSTGHSDLSGNFSSTSRHNFIGYDANSSNGINNGTNNNKVGESAPWNARLSALADWGGPTKTHKPLLGPDSPVLEAGDIAVAEAFELIFDQRGFDRFYFGTISIGAVELEDE
jgi:hypothetical protein